MHTFPFRRTLASALLLAGLAACAPPLPDSGPRGAGFDARADAAQRREGQLNGTVPLGSFDAPPSEAEGLARDTRAALGRPDLPPIGTPAPLPGAVIATGAPPDLDRDNPSISGEQDFATVARERDIAADAERLRAAREQYVVIQPTELERPSDTGPNVFDYALNRAQPVGTPAFRRGVTASASRSANRCAVYSSSDLAQAEFLGAGGPERDRLGLDPDGDGNACAWDPAVTRDLVRR